MHWMIMKCRHPLLHIYWLCTPAARKNLFNTSKEVKRDKSGKYTYKINYRLPHPSTMDWWTSLQQCKLNHLMNCSKVFLKDIKAAELSIQNAANEFRVSYVDGGTGYHLLKMINYLIFLRLENDYGKRNDHSFPNVAVEAVTSDSGKCPDYRGLSKHATPVNHGRSEKKWAKVIPKLC